MILLSKSRQFKLPISAIVTQQGLGTRVTLSRRLDLLLRAPNANKVAVAKLSTSQRKHTMRNYVSAARNMAGPTRPTTIPNALGMPRMTHDNLPTPQNDKALVHIEATTERKDVKTSLSSKQRWSISRLRWNTIARSAKQGGAKKRYIMTDDSSDSK